MTKSEAARFLRVSERTLERYRASGRLNAFKLFRGQQGRVLFRVEDLIAFLRACEDRPAT